MIGLTKSTIKKVLGRTHVSLTTLQTLVIKVEMVLNDRPLIYVSPDITDSEPLTPSHLLCGHRITSLPYMTVEDDDPTYGSACTQQNEMAGINTTTLSTSMER